MTVFWNAKGLSNLVQLSTPSEFGFIGITETFLRQDVKYLPAMYNNFHIFSSPAIRLRSRGRGSGGILVLVNKLLGEPLLLHRSENWIFVKISIGLKTYIFGTVYFIPKVDIIPALELLQSKLDSLLSILMRF